MRQKELHRAQNISIKMLLCMVLLMLVPVLSVKAASSLKLKYDNKSVTYSGKQISYNIDGKRVSEKNYPGIVIGSTSLASYKDLFIDSKIGVTSSYSSTKQTLTLKKDYTTIVFKLGSTVVYVDGNKKTVSQAPRKVTYGTTGGTKILVPVRFVAEEFGYSYEYSSSSGIANIKSPSVPALNIYHYDEKEWFTYRGIQGGAKVDGKLVNTKAMPSFLHESTTMIQAKLIFHYTMGADYKYDSASRSLTLTLDNNTLVTTLGSKKATCNGKAVTLPHAPMHIKNKATNKGYIMLPASAVANYLGYDFLWDSKNATSVFTKKKVVMQPQGPTDSKEEYVYGEFLMSDVYKEEYQALQQKEYATSVDTSLDTATVLGEVTKANTVYPDKEVFYLNAYSPVSAVTSEYTSDNDLVIDIKNSSTPDKTTYFNNSILKAATLTYNEESQSSKLVLTTNVAKPKYDIQISSDYSKLIITVYYNYIEKLQLKYNNSMDNATLTSFYPATIETSSEKNEMYLDLPFTVNSVGALKEEINKGYCLKNIQVTQKDATTTRIIFTKGENSTFFRALSGNELSIMFLYHESETDEDLKINLPDGVDYDDVVTRDYYYRNQFSIWIPGNYKEFYEKNPVQIYSSMVSDVSVTITSAGNTYILVTTLKLQGFRLIDNDSYISVKIDDPKKIYDKIVVLDPGHGGHDTGARKNGYNEKDLVFKILYTYGKKYFDGSSSTVKAYYTRTTDSFITLDDRAAFAKKVGADLFISLHMNAASALTAKGVETYYSSVNNSIHLSGLSSSRLAKVFQDGLIRKFGFYDRKVKAANFAVLKNNTVPAVLLELGFMTNSSDLEKLTSATKQKEYAKGIWELTEESFKLYPTGR